MKIKFEKLVTTSGKVYVDFGDGFQEYDVATVKDNGIQVPKTCTDYSKIQIKGSSAVLKNLDIISKIQLSNSTEEIYKSIEYHKFYKHNITNADYIYAVGAPDRNSIYSTDLEYTFLNDESDGITDVDDNNVFTINTALYPEGYDKRIYVNTEDRQGQNPYTGEPYDTEPYLFICKRPNPNARMVEYRKLTKLDFEGNFEYGEVLTEHFSSSFMSVIRFQRVHYYKETIDETDDGPGIILNYEYLVKKLPTPNGEKILFSINDENKVYTLQKDSILYIIPEAYSDILRFYHWDTDVNGEPTHPGQSTSVYFSSGNTVYTNR